MAKKFPTVPVVLLVVGVIWLLQDLGLITVKIPLIPIVLIIASIGWIMKSYK